MLSKGRVDADNVFSLKDGNYPPASPSDRRFFAKLLNLGTLTIYLDKETYERAGLVGKPYGVKGKRGLKPRWGKRLFMCTPYWNIGVLI